MRYRWGIALLAACALALAPGASAAVVGGTGGAATLTVFEALDCPDGFESHPANGIDAYVIDLAGRGGQVRVLTWSSAGVNTNNNTVTTRFYSDECETVGVDSLVRSGQSFATPAAARWLAVIPGPGTVVTAFTVS